jgi:SsrA-binding protein
MGRQMIDHNKKARHNYHVLETIEAGLVLLGTEVKSLRNGRASIGESYAGEIKGELFLLNSHISTYKFAHRDNHDPKRARKLLVSKKQCRHLLADIQQKRQTLVPISLYFNNKGIAKVELGLCKGKDKADKRQSLKEKEWKREKRQNYGL